MAENDTGHSAIFRIRTIYMPASKWRHDVPCSARNFSLQMSMFCRNFRKSGSAKTTAFGERRRIRIQANPIRIWYIDTKYITCEIYMKIRSVVVVWSCWQTSNPMTDKHCVLQNHLDADEIERRIVHMKRWQTKIQRLMKFIGSCPWASEFGVS